MKRRLDESTIIVAVRTGQSTALGRSGRLLEKIHLGGK